MVWLNVPWWMFIFIFWHKREKPSPKRYFSRTPILMMDLNGLPNDLIIWNSAEPRKSSFDIS